MDRRSLVLRRFGPLEFGLGFFDAGTWIDHTALPDRGASLVMGAGLGVIHDMLGCCSSVGDAAIDRTVRSTAIAIETSVLVATLVDRRDHGQPGARRTSAR